MPPPTRIARSVGDGFSRAATRSLHLRRHERRDRGLRFRKRARIPRHRQRARAGEVAARIHAEAADVEGWEDGGPDVARRHFEPLVHRGCRGKDGLFRQRDELDVARRSRCGDEDMRIDVRNQPLQPRALRGGHARIEEKVGFGGLEIDHGIDP